MSDADKLHESYGAIVEDNSAVAANVNLHLEDNVAQKMIDTYGLEKALDLVALNAGYAETPVGIDEFVESDEFMGKMTKQGKMIYPRWRKILRDIFPDDQKYVSPFKIVVFNTCIGSGKTNTARIMIAYMMHKFMCIRDPHDYYSHQRTNPYSFACWAPTKATAADLLLSETWGMLQSSSWFKKKMEGPKSDTLPHKIELKMGSVHSHFVGRNVPTAIFTELAFERFGGQAEQNFNSVYKRVTSRFQKNNTIPFPVIIDCSIGDDQTFVKKVMEDYKDEAIYTVDGPIWSFKPRSNYKVETFDVFTGTDTIDAFILEDDDPSSDVVRESPELENRILSVPMDFVADFRSDLRTSLNDIAGVLTSSSIGFLSSIATLKSATCLPDPLTRKMIRLGGVTDQTGERLIDFMSPIYLAQFPSGSHGQTIDDMANSQNGYSSGHMSSLEEGMDFLTNDRDQMKLTMERQKRLNQVQAHGRTVGSGQYGLWKGSTLYTAYSSDLIDAITQYMSGETEQGLVGSLSTIRDSEVQDALNEALARITPERLTLAPRSIHIDIGVSNDLTGIASTYVASTVRVKRVDPSTGHTSVIEEPIYVTEWVMYVGSKPNTEVPIYKIRDLILDLRVRGIPIWKISLDGYQSTQIKQELIAAGFECEIISVDRTKEPYLLWKRGLSEHRWLCVDSERVRDEAKGLVDTGKKIDHKPIEGKSQTALIDSKDGLDGIAGSIAALFQGQPESPELTQTNAISDELDILNGLTGGTMSHEIQDRDSEAMDMLTRMTQSM